MVSHIIDGRAIAKKCRLELKQKLKDSPQIKLTIVVVGDNPVIETYVGAKVRAAEKIGILASVVRKPETITEKQLIEDLYTEFNNTDGIIVQLPLPAHIDRERVLNTIPSTHDVDVLTEGAYALFEKNELPCTPPVASAVLKALTDIGFTISGSKMAVIGYGKLVGMPCDVLFTRLGAHVEIVRKNTDPEERLRILKNAQVIISGIGVPNSLKAADISEGVILLDAGTSEREGGTAGDLDPDCLTVASHVAAVPGGIGPLTVVSLFENLVILSKNQSK